MTDSPAESAARQVEGLLSRMFEMGRSPRYVGRLLSLAGAPVQPSGWQILNVLQREGPQRISQLAALLSLDQSTVSRQLKPLDDEGLVRRAADPHDKRSTIVAMTAAGRRVYDAVRRRWLDDLAWFIRDWRVADQLLLGDLAERLSSEVDRGRSGFSQGDPEPARAGRRTR